MMAAHNASAGPAISWPAQATEASRICDSRFSETDVRKGRLPTLNKITVRTKSCAWELAAATINIIKR